MKWKKERKTYVMCLTDYRFNSTFSAAYFFFAHFTEVIFILLLQKMYESHVRDDDEENKKT